MADLAWAPLIVALVASTVGAVTDIWKFRVYNLLTFPLMAGGLLYHGITAGWSGLGTSLLGLLCGLAILIVPYLLGLMGAGDVKLLAGVGAWLGPLFTTYVFAVAALIAGAYAVVLIVCRGKLHESWITLKLIFYRFTVMGVHFGKDDLVEDLSVSPDRRLRLIPFGAMIPLGIVGAIMWLYFQQPIP